MTFEDIQKYFGNSYQFFKKTGMGSTNYLNWQRRGYIPIETQVKLEKMTNGELKADLSHIPND